MMMRIYNVNVLMSPPGFDYDDDGNTSSARSGGLAYHKPVAVCSITLGQRFFSTIVV